MKATTDSAATEVESTDTEHTDARPDDCDCWDAEAGLPCWPCYREGFEEQTPETPGANDEGDEDREEGC